MGFRRIAAGRGPFELSYTDRMKRADVPLVTDKACGSAYRRHPDQTAPDQNMTFHPAPTQTSDHQPGQLVPMYPAVLRHREGGDLLHSAGVYAAPVRLSRVWTHAAVYQQTVVPRNSWTTPVMLSGPCPRLMARW
ncbi:hypothetical protein GCM10010168_50440 [Actinoplanes ianthinogenes]|uniref:Uncharacterized protein n=1 Tax=Actinoplanes ianthinogenes TaxID=122358 RepID=A0ABM7M3G6_9ACTN|nr:hypothetical protein Aiant_67520 [Actinoplanes ianthinogenes]GGR26187.1 hypothetical protein GCM10010168_50440 [Actinoplanes ianthinogenes]